VLRYKFGATTSLTKTQSSTTVSPLPLFENKIDTMSDLVSASPVVKQQTANQIETD
jgi:hypothetical protein